ncbi:uncharacterized protein LOC110101254 [Dendrobium catenatum]|uniref:Uncharacterized protein n=1 Tax=Dendrobium catenatum TaxID=906689 RepID=A0A2I0W0F1_9ASPA|nr:uncharacterized protein LOC110101254 [Dendrobium catenatum]XP_028555041.1 uncharacterized protein LOC110101254 [Dendrobium catenatum]PKU69143.1 hypothetical protein MA16_Dca002413 [Dendrobium catenatum]
MNCSLIFKRLSMENDKDWSKIEAKIVSDGSLHLKLDGNPSKLDYNEENFNNGAKNELSDVEENGGKVVSGSRKSKNPTFAIVQTKFEELGSAPDSNRFIDYASTDVVNVSKSSYSQMVFISKEVNKRKAVYSKVDKDVNLNKKLSCHCPKDQGTASAYATEIYVSSLDKPEDSLSEIAPELRISNVLNHGVVTVGNGSLKFDETKIETNNYLSNLIAVLPQKKEESSKNVAISVSSIEEVQGEDKDTYVDNHRHIGLPKAIQLLKILLQRHPVRYLCM